MADNWFQSFLTRARDNFDQAINALSKYAFSLRTVLITSLVLFVYTATSDASRNPSSFGYWVLLALLVHVTFIIEMLVFSFFIRRLKAKLLRAVIALTAFFSVGMLRGACIGSLSLLGNLVEQVDWSYRLFGSATITLINGVFITLVVADNQEFKLRRAQLEETESQLREGSDSLGAKLETRKSEIIDSLNRRIQSAVASIGLVEKSSTPPEAVVKKLLKLTDDVLRPISQDIKLTDEWQSLERVELRPRVLFLETLKSSTVATPFQPVSISAVWLIIGYLNLRTIGASAEADLAVISAVVWLFTTLSVAKLILLKHIRKLSFAARVFAIGVLFAVVSIGAGFATYLPLAGYQASKFANLPQTLLVLLPAQVLFSLAVVALIAGLRSQRFKVIRRLERINQDLRRQVATKNAYLRSLEIDLKSEVHTQVQGSLISAALRLQQAIDVGADTQALQSEVRKLIVEGTTISGVIPTTPLPVSLAQFAERWRGIIEISWEIDPSVQVKLLEDWVLLKTLNILIGDSINNSVKHSRATKIGFKFAHADQENLLFEATDDGKKPSAQVVPGQGFKFLAEVSISFEAVQLKEGFRVQALLPINQRFLSTR